MHKQLSNRSKKLWENEIYSLIKGKIANEYKKYKDDIVQKNIEIY